VRSTICISMMALTLGGAAMAQGVPTGCFIRDYDAAHLAAQPAQVVSAMWLRIEPVEEVHAFFEMTVRMADQGHAGKAGLGGQILSEGGACLDGARCFVDCDGGGFAVTRQQGDSIDITTDWMRVARFGCGGDEADAWSDLAEIPGQSTTYRLYRAPDAACDRN
jgi:hypothetical protein